MARRQHQRPCHYRRRDLLSHEDQHQLLGLPRLPQIRLLKTEEAQLALFNPDSPTGGGNIFRVEIPADKKFLRHNTLCGSESTQWIVTYAQGRDLHIALFSGATPPVLTVDALNDAPNLCGIFSYVR